MSQAPQALIQAPLAQVQVSPTRKPPAQGPAIEVSLMQIPSIQAPLAQIPPVQVSLVPAPPRQAALVQAPIAQELPVQVSPVLAALVQAPLQQVPAIQAPGAGLLKKKSFQIYHSGQGNCHLQQRRHL